MEGNMNKVNGYHPYQTNSYNNVNRKSSSRTSQSTSSKTDGAGKTNSNPVQLSSKAKALLQELKKTYSNMDFIVADYESEEEAASYLSRGTKDYSVLIDPEELERMASDDDVKEQNLSLLDDAVGKLDEMTKQLGDKKDEVVRMGVHIGKNGEVSYFAELEKAGERQKEFIDKIREEKKENAQETASKTDAGTRGKYEYTHSKRTTLYASTADELLDKINHVNWDDIQEETAIPTPGGRFDFTV